MSQPVPNKALTLLDEHLDTVGIVDTSGVATAEDNAVNLAALVLGAETVDLVGVDRYVRPRSPGDGGTTKGTMYAPRLASQAVASQGPAILLKIPGTGAIDAKGAEITIGRVAIGPNDYFAEYSAALDAPFVWNNSSNNYLNLPKLTINVKCAKGVTTLIRAVCALELDPSNTATTIESSLSIGAGVDGLAWQDGQDAVETAVWKTNARNPAFHRHSRLILGTDATETTGVVVTPRVRRIGEASGGYNPIGTLQAGAPIRLASQANVRSTPSLNAITTLQGGAQVRFAPSSNVRSGPSTDDDVVYTTGSSQTGYVASGPYSGSGYSWWLCAVTGGGAGYVASINLTVINESANANILYVAPAGSVGTVVSGPINSGGYAWYLCNITGVGSGYIPSTQLIVTDSAPPISQTNAIVNAWITVERIPL